ncbi:hypothetical protein HK103_005535 [Boothiomyces macroporosus]|uniref:Uncharacterized protein n=1 Tax=Boothiomyces macroporosus TaxID=261099 RepID=A0AAD5UF02_9FUNG|nr:hypothetical protein HK103_005535 [Boothiomyces macroporosus]
MSEYDKEIQSALEDELISQPSSNRYSQSSSIPKSSALGSKSDLGERDPFPQEQGEKQLEENPQASEIHSNQGDIPEEGLQLHTTEMGETEKQEDIVDLQEGAERGGTENQDENAQSGKEGENIQSESQGQNIQSGIQEEEQTDSVEPEKTKKEESEKQVIKAEVPEKDYKKNKELELDLEFQEVQYANPNVIEETFENPIVFDEADGQVPHVSIKQNELHEKKLKSVRIEDNAIIQSRWPTSVRAISRFSHHSEKHSARSKRNESSLKQSIPEFQVQKINGKYTEIPHLLDAPAEDPDQVYSLDLSRKSLEFVIEDDMTMFTNLHTLIVAENALPFARLGLLPALRKLNFSCNGLKSLDLEVDGRFQNLEYLDLSFNNINRAAMIVLATLPKLNYLDLTSNRIKTIHPDILDMHNWRDNVIELILPLQVAAMDFDFESNAKSTEVHSEKFRFDDVHKDSTLPDFKLDLYETSGVSNSIMNSNVSDNLEAHGSLYEIPKTIGFQALHTLILDKNPLGNSPDPQFWKVLGSLTCIQKLSLNYAHIKSIRPVIPDILLSKSGPEIMFMHPDILPKSELFLSLTDLYLTHNLIDDFDCLVGFICLRKIERIFLEGNPIMKSFVPNHLLSKKRAASAKLRNSIINVGEDFDLYAYLENVFKIKIADACYQPPLSHITGELISISPSRTNTLPQAISKKGPREFLHKRINKFNSNISNPHRVQDVKLTSKTKIKERTARRHYQFTDNDLEVIVQSGKIPTIKSLMEYANKQEQVKLAEPKEEIQHAISIIESNTESSEKNTSSLNESSEIDNPSPDDIDRNSTTHNESGEHQASNSDELNYDPDKRDDTFITGVHITGTMNRNVAFSVAPISQDVQKEESVQFEYESESDNETIALPTSIIATVKALRTSLRNPGIIQRQSNMKKKIKSKREIHGNHT